MSSKKQLRKAARKERRLQLMAGYRAACRTLISNLRRSKEAKPEDFRTALKAQYRQLSLAVAGRKEAA